MVVVGLSNNANLHIVYGVYIALPLYDVVVFKVYIFAYRPIEKIIFFIS